MIGDPPSPNPTKTDFSLNDALSHFRSIIDNTHRYINYFQIVIATAVATVIGKIPNDVCTVKLVIVGIIIFGFFNGRLAVNSQKEAYEAWLCIQRAEKSDHLEISNNLRPLIALRQPDKPNQLAIYYVTIVIVSILLIYYVTFFSHECPFEVTNIVGDKQKIF